MSKCGENLRGLVFIKALLTETHLGAELSAVADVVVLMPACQPNVDFSSFVKNICDTFRDVSGVIQRSVEWKLN